MTDISVTEEGKWEEYGHPGIWQWEFCLCWRLPYALYGRAIMSAGGRGEKDVKSDGKRRSRSRIDSDGEYGTTGKQIV